MVQLVQSLNSIVEWNGMECEILHYSIRFWMCIWLYSIELIKAVD